MGKWFRSVIRGYGQGTLDEGVLVVQKDATRDSVDVWIAVVALDPLTDSLHATVTAAGRRIDVVLARYVLDEGPVDGVPANAGLFHNHVTVPGLAAGGSYPVSVEVAGHGSASCHTRTLPAALPRDRTFRIFTASCYDVGTDSDDKLNSAYGRVFPEPPDLTMLVGDQVYADAPFRHYFLRSRTNPRAGLLLKYWMTWGMSRTRPRRGLNGVLTTGPNYFLPDDHEFWNNWPNQSATTKDSYARIGTALLDAWKRRWAIVPDNAVVTRRPPANPEEPPSGAIEQSYFPTHPAERGKWSLASFELFGAFQTRSRADRIGEPTRGVADRSRIGPPDPDGAAVNPPRNVIVQTVDIDPVTVCLLDTRTRRTRRLRHPVLSGFVDEVYLDQMLAHARRAAIFVLATPQPLLRPAAWRTAQDTPEQASAFGDVGMWDYWHQWERLWAGLVEARDGRPTITVGGDIHQSYVAFAPELNLVEVVASPMSMVWGGNLLRWGQRLMRKHHHLDYRPGSAFVAVDDVVAGPAGRLTGRFMARAVSAGCLGPAVAGFAALSLQRTDDDTVTADVALYDRDRVAGHGGARPAVHARYGLSLAGGGVTRLAV